MYKSTQINMTEGPIFIKLLQFSIPLIFSSLLQLLFNAADIVVLGRFAGDNSLAAVGSTGSLINLLVNLFIGLSVGANVLAAHYFGANKKEELKSTIHTTMIISLLSGILLSVIGILFAEPILHLMQAPAEVLHLAALYLRIYFAGITASMIYNFGSSLLRAKGDTRRPLIILSIAGVINVLLNLIFVIFFSMDVAGVALATIISQVFSAVFIIILLLKEKDDFKLDLKSLKINPHILGRIIKIGLPAGFQGIMFSFSNVIIQSSVNSFGANLVAGNSAALNLEGFIYTSMNGFSQGSLTFCSQNLGAKKIDRIKKVTYISQISIFVIGFSLSMLGLLFVEELLGIYSKNPIVVEKGMLRLSVIFSTYYLCGMMDSMANTIRACGHSLMPALITIFGACILRILWLSTIFQIDKFHNPTVIYLSYPISWGITFIMQLICFIFVYKKIKEN